MVARDVPLTTRLGASVGSELSPDAAFPIARDHGNGDQKLDDSDHTLQRLVPGRAAGGHRPGELQCGGWKAQHAKDESNQDKPESPSPATEGPDHEDSDTRRERNQQRSFNREAFPIDLLQGLRVDLRGEDQNRNERDPNKHKESDHQLLGAIEGSRETQPERAT